MRDKVRLGEAEISGFLLVHFGYPPKFRIPGMCMRSSMTG